MAGWNTDRPIFHRLPKAYDSEVVDWMTQPFDELVVNVKNSIHNYIDLFLNPDTAIDSAFDNYIRYIFGFSDDYWDSNWDISIKRTLCKNAYNFLWINRGNIQCLNFLLETFSFSTINENQVYIPERFRVGFQIPYQIKDNDFDFFIRLTSNYSRGEYDWKLAESFVTLYSPVWARGLVCYDYFRVGKSRIGDPIFDWIYETGKPIAKAHSGTDYELFQALFEAFDIELISKITLEPFRLGSSALPGRLGDNSSYLILSGDIDIRKLSIAEHLLKLFNPGKASIAFQGFKVGGRIPAILN